MSKIKAKNPIKLIFNPKAGAKRRMVHTGGIVTIEEIQILMDQYQLPVDLAPTHRVGEARLLAATAKEEGYQMVVVAGGDGTINEAANGLVGSDISMGVLPLGTYMNIAHMLSIPFELEKAVQIIKIGRTRKIDVGMVTKIAGEKLEEPYYFLESSGIDTEALMHQEFTRFEHGSILALFQFIITFFSFHPIKVHIKTDTEEFDTHASMISVANGPFTGAALEIAPGAKLNDHLLTIAIYSMTKKDFFWYFIKMMTTGKANRKQLKMIQTAQVTLTTTHPTLVHINGSLFTKTPVQYKILPAALTVICGFPRSEADSSLVPKTYLDY